MRRHPLVTRPLARLAAAALLSATGCAGDDRPVVRVFAAASLAAPFEQLADAFAARRPEVRVELHCAGTPQLVLQLREGAPADVFASADLVQMQNVVDAGRAATAPRPFASNHLIIVTPPANPRGVTSLQDLARDDVTVLLCGPNVPAGRYARMALERAGVAVRSVSDEPSVRAVVSKVRLGVADAGIVYHTDALAAGDAVHAVPIAPHFDVPATYPIVAVANGVGAARGQEFVAFVLGPEGRAILSRHGFAAP
ncbi:MAG: molybdate ABC transporter substrate-binding protein [Planctomycetes bacterium]|nr:molybdate ABC transporter substrate-binding protein [Planctomycetota bacterium]